MYCRLVYLYHGPPGMCAKISISIAAIPGICAKNSISIAAITGMCAKSSGGFPQVSLV
ncbi:hypothetical protein Hanom_Chr16g01499211 [Helianthus anomalus]